jgi:hypothetical protein
VFLQATPLRTELQSLFVRVCVIFGVCVASPGDVPSRRPTLLKDTLHNFRTYLTPNVYRFIEGCRAPCKLPVDLGRADKQTKRRSETTSPSKKSADGKIHQRTLHLFFLLHCKCFLDLLRVMTFLIFVLYFFLCVPLFPIQYSTQCDVCRLSKV